MTQQTNSDSSSVVISNPRSGGNKKGGIDKFKSLMAGYPDIEHIILSDFSCIDHALEKAKDNNRKIIIVNGGDGTLQSILTFLKREGNQSYNPELVLMKSGTTSMCYGDVGFKTGARNMLNAVSHYGADENSLINKKSRQVLRMTLPKEGTSVCGMFFGAAAIYSGILYCRQNIHTRGIRGETGPALAMLRFLFDWMTVNKIAGSTSASIDIDQQETISGDFSIIAATTLKRLLAGVYPFWGHDPAKDTYALSLIRHGAPKSIRSVLKILRGRTLTTELNNTYYHSYHVSRALLNISGGFTLDGELFGEQGKSNKVVLESAGPVTFLTA